MNTQLINQIKEWIKDFEKLNPNEPIYDDNDETIEGSAYSLLVRALKELKDADQNVKDAYNRA